MLFGCRVVLASLLEEVTLELPPRGQAQEGWKEKLARQREWLVRGPEMGKNLGWSQRGRSRESKMQREVG